MSTSRVTAGATPRVMEMRVVPVAGHDSMLLNLSGARDDAVAMQYLVPGWTFDRKRPCLVR